MNAISLWQPWASLWAAPNSPKVYETRNWLTPVRGWTLVHASKRASRQELEITPDVDRVASAVLGAKWRETVPYGAVVGAVRIDHCQPCDQVLRTFLEGEYGPDVLHTGNFANGRWAWRRSDAVLFEKPIPFVGRQRWFQVPSSALPPTFLSFLEVGA